MPPKMCSRRGILRVWQPGGFNNKLNGFIDHKAFHLTKRERTKPDRINSLLNFGYDLLFSRINATVRAASLAPFRFTGGKLNGGGRQIIRHSATFIRATETGALPV